MFARYRKSSPVPTQRHQHHDVSDQQVIDHLIESTEQGKIKWSSATGARLFARTSDCRLHVCYKPAQGVVQLSQDDLILWTDDIVIIVDPERNERLKIAVLDCAAVDSLGTVDSYYAERRRRVMLAAVEAY